ALSSRLGRTFGAKILATSLLLAIMVGVNVFDAAFARPKLNIEAGDFHLVDIEGRNFRLSDFRGKIVLLEFFVSSCSPCKPQLLELKGVRAAYPKDILVIVSISFDPSVDTVQALKQLAGSIGVDWIVARDTAGISDDYGIEIAPTILLIDGGGVVRRVHEGFTEKGVLIADVGELLEVKSKEPPGTSSLWNVALIIIVAIAAFSAGFLAWHRRKSAKRRRTKR
ncbi:TlpA family protein disulfide reductase, partial [Candidatus Bathyarchaeota archaeon]|nr:TlpA family protein disulfide reductase [Candidatus Bathyarchaeota archaeon]